MTPVDKTAPSTPTWFKLGLILILLFSLMLRFWGLSRFNVLVFDEVYYAKFAHNYLSWTPFFDGHPPLSKYLIAIGIWIGNQIPIGQDTINAMAGAPYTTWSYRWLNALTGSFIPLVMAGVAYQLSHRYTYSLIAGLLTALDGMLLVESRYALNNVYLLIFGLGGLWCMLLALNSGRPLRRSVWLLLSGVLFGASASVKWNGLWFLLGAYGLWVGAWFWRWVQARRPHMPELFPTEPGEPDRTLPRPSPLQRLTRLSWWQIGLNWAVVPFGFYMLEWIPHLKLNAKQGLWADFWHLQQEILSYHERVGDGPNIHPYCSSWWSWLIMQRPVAYFYQAVAPNQFPPDGTAPASSPLIYDVHAMGNPVLWWFSTAAILVVISLLVQHIVQWFRARPATASGDNAVESASFRPLLHSSDRWLLAFVLMNYAANLLPWVRVTRCKFIYHYMGASLFAVLAIAWFIDRWLRHPDSTLRQLALGLIGLMGLALLFWLPIYLGLPLSPFGFKLRMWLPSWV